MRHLILVLLATFALSGCSSWVYTQQIQQGNVIDQDDVNKLEPGMSKRFVEIILGTPVVRDPFNPDRWTYYNSIESRDGSVTRKHLTLFFENDKLIKLEGDYRPEDFEEELAQEG